MTSRLNHDGKKERNIGKNIKFIQDMVKKPNIHVIKVPKL